MLQATVRIATSDNFKRRFRCHTFAIRAHEAARMYRSFMLAAVLSVVLAGVGYARDSSFEVNDNSAPAPVATVPPHPSVAALESLGRQLFFDRNLSASHQLSCSSCHDPAHAYGPPNAKAVQLGGKDGRLQGQRAVPSLRYLQNVPLFTEN